MKNSLHYKVLWVVCLLFIFMIAFNDKLYTFAKDIDDIQVNDVKEVNIKESGEENGYKLFKFVPEEEGCYHFYSSDNGENDNQCDPIVYLLDESENQIASNDDGNGDRNFDLFYKCEQGKIYYIKAAICGYYTGNYKIHLEKSNITAIKITLQEPVQVKEESSGYWCATESGDWFNYDFRYTFKNNDTIEVTNEEAQSIIYTYNEEQNGFFDNQDNRLPGYVVSEPDQYDNHWVKGTDNNLIFTYKGCTDTVPVTIIDSDVTSIQYVPLSPIKIICEGNGDWQEDGEKWFRYNYQYKFQEGDTLTVTTGEGDAAEEATYTWGADEYGDYGFFDEVNNQLEGGLPTFIDNQEEAHWSLGNANSLTVRFKACNATIPVEIVENNITAISFEPTTPIEMVEERDGYWSWDEDGNKWFCYYNYDFQEGDKLTVTTGEDAEPTTYRWSADEDGNYGFYDEDDNPLVGMISISSDQERSHWSLGDNNNLTIQYFGLTTTVPVSVVESNVTAISFEPTTPIEMVEERDGYWSWDEDGNKWFCYYNYDFQEGDKLTVTTGEDAEPTTYRWSADKYGFYDDEGNQLPGLIEITSDQENSHWTVGDENSFTITYLKQTTTVPVSIVESDVTAISFEPTTAIVMVEERDGVWEWDDDDNKWFFYDYDFQEGDKLTVTTGEDVEPTTYRWSADKYGFYDDEGNQLPGLVEITSDQKNNHWTVEDENSFTITYLKQTTTVPVSIVESDVTAISFEPTTAIVMVEERDGVWEWDDDDNKWFFYDYDFQEGDKLTVTTGEDAEPTTYRWSADEDGNYGFYDDEGNQLPGLVEITSDQKNNHWTVGDENSFTITYLKQTTTVPVSIVESDVTAISFEPANTPIEMVEERDGYWEGEEGKEWFFYDYDFQEGDKLTVTTGEGDDAEEVTYTWSADKYGFYDKDGNCLAGSVPLISDQEKSHWTAGKEYHFTLVYCGKETTFSVTIKKSTAENNDLEKANSVIAAITSLPDANNVTVNNKAAIEAADAAFAKLTDAQKALISDELKTKLSNTKKALAAVERATDQKAADQKAANAVIAKINALPNPAGSANESAVKAARDAYDKLTADQKKLVSSALLQKLTNAEKQVKDAKAAEAAKKAAEEAAAKKAAEEAAKNPITALGALNTPVVLKKGAAKPITVFVTAKDNSKITTDTATVKSAKPKIANVSAVKLVKGKLTFKAKGLRAGKSVVTAKVGAKSVKVIVIVQAKANSATNLAAKKSVTVKANKTAKVVVKVTSKNAKLFVTDLVTAKSSKAAIAGVTNIATAKGKVVVKVKGLKKGKSVLVVKVGKKAVKVNVIVK